MTQHNTDDNTDKVFPLTKRRAASPRAAAIAGLLFAVLFSISVTLILASAIRIDSAAGGELALGSGWLSFAIGLMPFAGLFFLWFIAVARARLGQFEDQFFSTVFLGSGLVFLAMVFVAAGMAGGISLEYSHDPSFVRGETFSFARDVVSQIFTIYAMRMAAVFIFSQSTLWLRTKVMPRWLAYLSIVAGLVLLFALSEMIWVVLVFPAWVFLVSVYILIAGRRHPEGALEDAVTPTASEQPDQG